MKHTASPTNRISDIIVPGPPAARRIYIDRQTMQRIAAPRIMPAADVAVTAPRFAAPAVTRTSWVRAAALAASTSISGTWAIMAGYFVSKQRHYTAPRFRWAPKRYTREQGVHTNWQALKPSRTAATGTSSLLVLLLVAASFSSFSSQHPPAVPVASPTSRTGQRIGGGVAAWPSVVATKAASAPSTRDYGVPARVTTYATSDNSIPPADMTSMAESGGMGGGDAATSTTATPTTSSTADSAVDTPASSSTGTSVSTPDVAVQVGQVATVQVPGTSLDLPL